MAYLIGIDVGTTGAKTILVDESGQLHASALEEYPLYTPQPKWAEQNPEDWWQATVKSIQRVIADSQVSPKEITGLGLSGQMHGLVLMDNGHRVLRRAIYGVMCERRSSVTTSERLSVRICWCRVHVTPHLRGLLRQK